MSNNIQNPVLEEVKNLISYSIKNKEAENANFEDLHRKILKKYFDARNIKIDYKAQSIDLQLPISKTNYTNITFECLDLKGFLHACLKADDQSLYFYKNLLAQYNVESAA